MVATAEDRLVAELRRQLQALDPGARLPSARELSRRFRVSPVTVASAVGRLVGQGVIVTRPGRGTFVAERSAARAPVDLSWQAVALGAAGVDAGGLDELLAPVPDDAINLASGFIDESLLPVSALTAAAMRAARRPGAWARPPLEGLPELRAAVLTARAREQRPDALSAAEALEHGLPSRRSTRERWCGCRRCSRGSCSSSTARAS